MVLVVKKPPANVGDGDVGCIPGSGRSPGGGHGNPLQYSCLENTMDRGAWWATAYRVAQSQTSSLVNFKEHFQYLSQGDTRHIVGAQHISFEPN